LLVFCDSRKQPILRILHVRKIDMLAISTLNRRRVVSLIILVCLLVATSISALAVPAAQVFRDLSNKNLAGLCCYLWGSSVKITEPAAVAPVVVTWSMDYITDREFIVGLSVNNGPCLAYGSRQVPASPFGVDFDSKTFQWVVLPSDGLVKGVNTFAVCGGGQLAPSDQITLGPRTLAVRLGK
jgi:hypothetical protein